MLPSEEIVMDLYRTANGSVVRFRHLPTDLSVTFMGIPDHYQRRRLLRRLELLVRKMSEPVVTSLPLDQLEGSRNRPERFLTTPEIQEILSENGYPGLSFIFAEVGLPLDRYDPEDAFTLWKKEIKPHLIEQEKYRSDDLPDGYGYYAYSWPVEGNPVILLEMHH